MAEALGIASGIAGLVSLTIEVFGISYKYIHGVRDASSSARRFLSELEDLQTVLLRVDQVAQRNDQAEVFGDAGSCLFSIQNSNEYVDTLEKIRDKLQQRQTSSSLRAKMMALTWPYSEKVTLALSEFLHRQLEIYNTALAVDSRTIAQITLGEMRQITISQADSRVKAVLDWLSPLNMYQKQQDTLSRRHGITSSWLLVDPIFKAWIDSESSQQSLWCPGNPGTGKTVITSVVIDHLINNYVDEDTRIAYIYCDYKNQTAQTAANLVACLVRQIIGRTKTLPKELATMHEELSNQNRRPSFDELKRLLVAVCNQYTRTYILVDALDECEASRERRLLLPLLESLPNAPTRLFVTSRPNSEDISQSFHNASQIDIEAPESDIRGYIMERIDERRDSACPLAPELKEEIISTISTRASGMFLFAALQADRTLSSKKVKGIKSALTSMPNGLDELYRQAVERIKKQEDGDAALGMKILSWIMHAKRPLSVDELRHGLAVEYEGDVEGTPAEFDKDNLDYPKTLVDVCAGLLTIEPSSQIIRLVHFTTQEYFDKERLHLFEGADLDISRACLTYLSYTLPAAFDGSAKVHEAYESNLFLHYACRHWFSHVKKCLLSENSDSVLSRIVTRFKSSEIISMSVVILLRRPKRRFTELGPTERKSYTLEVASYLGLEDLVTVLLDHRTGAFPGLDGSLLYALCRGEMSTVKLLLQYGARVDLDSIEKFLLQNGADTHGGRLFDWPPDPVAMLYRDPGMIDLLLKNGANINARDSLVRTACHWVVLFDSKDSVKILLNAGCDLQIKDNGGMTVHDCATSQRREDMIELLSKSGVDASTKAEIERIAQDTTLNNILKLREHQAKGGIKGHTGQLLRSLGPKLSGLTTHEPEKTS